MTGYGQAELNCKNATFSIEVKSLNSKQLDVHIKMPLSYREKEVDLKRLASEKLQRGKIEISIRRESMGSNFQYSLNKALIKDYYEQILDLKKDLGIKINSWSFSPFRANSTDIIPSLLKMPEVIQKKHQEKDLNEWRTILKGINKAIDNALQFRIQEGKYLESDIKSRIKTISSLLLKIAPFEKERIKKIKENLKKKLSVIDTKILDENRFEQELIYYLEKQDIAEEQVRLDSHIKYFIETINDAESSGKKLGFISQEILREVNTIGSKASDSEIQKLVVQMKEEIEKIKEQLLNIL